MSSNKGYQYTFYKKLRIKELSLKKDLDSLPRYINNRVKKDRRK